MANWKFVEKLPNMKSREAMQGEFFANSSIEDETHALVREAIQNSLDARIEEAEGPVYVRFRVSGTKPASVETMSSYIDTEAWNHFAAKGNGLESPIPKSEPCNFLVYEDFNTTGLEGDIHQSEIEEDSDNPFYYFMRAEGQSGKSDEDRGRWGVGKFVFPHASAIRSVFILTVRHSDKKRYLAGQCILRSHKVDGKSYTPDGWFGDFDGEYDFQLPTADVDIAEKFIRDFSLARGATESGLSVVVPYVSADLSLHHFAKNVINEYFFPILRGDLVVAVCDADAELVIDQDYLKGDRHSDVFELDKNTIKMLELAKKALAVNDTDHIDLIQPEKAGAPYWEPRVTPEVATEIRDALASEERMASVRVPIYVRQKKKLPEASFFDMYLLKDDLAESSVPLFVREGIRIPEAGSRQIRGYRALINIEHGAIANMLGDAENPAHTEWEKTSSKYKNKYDWGPSTIDFMRTSAAKLLQLLSQNDDEEDRNILADIFYIDLPDNDDDVPDGAKRKRKKKKGGDKPCPDFIPPEKHPRYYRLSKSTGGFIVRGPEEKLEVPREYTVKVAYDTNARGNAFKKYQVTDFDLGNGNISVDAIKTDNLTQSENIIRFRSKDGIFKLQLTGFDPIRDLIVDVKSKELEHETV